MGFLKRKEIEDTFASKGPYKGKPRKNIFVLKIKDKKTFNLGANGDGDEVYGKKFIARRWPYILEYTLSKTSKKIYKIDATKISADARVDYNILYSMFSHQKPVFANFQKILFHLNQN